MSLICVVLVVTSFKPSMSPQLHHLSLLLLVAVVAVWLALTVHSARKQREAVAAIEALGRSVGYVHVGYEHGSNLPPGPQWLRELVGDEYFVTIILVRLDSTQITDADLEHLKLAHERDDDHYQQHAAEKDHHDDGLFHGALRRLLISNQTVRPTAADATSSQANPNSSAIHAGTATA